MRQGAPSGLCELQRTFTTHRDVGNSHICHIHICSLEFGTVRRGTSQCHFNKCPARPPAGQNDSLQSKCHCPAGILNWSIKAIRAYSWQSLPSLQQQHGSTPHTHASTFCRREIVDPPTTHSQSRGCHLSEASPLQTTCALTLMLFTLIQHTYQHRKRYIKHQTGCNTANL